MKRFSRRAPANGDHGDHDLAEEDDQTLEGELLEQLGLRSAPAPATARGNGGGKQGPRWRAAVRELLALLADIRSKIRSDREACFYEMGLRAAHVQQALKAKEPDRARSHAQAIARAAKRAGHEVTEPPTMALLKSFAQNDRERDLFTLGFNASLFEEAVANMRLTDADRLVDQIVDLVERL